MNNEISIKVFSDVDDITFIQSALKRTGVPNLTVLKQEVPQIKSIKEEIVIFQLGIPQSNLLQELLKFKKVYENRFLIIFLYRDDILKDALVSLGFSDIIYMPEEIGKFDSILNEILKSSFSFQKILIETEEGKIDLSTLVGGTENTFQRITLVKKAAENSNLNILITGETGTGKELLAKVIHSYYNASEPFVDICCTSLPENELDLELSGFEKSDLPDIVHKRLGLFELAEHGTILLDEISGLSLTLQSKLLRVIDRKVIRHIGSDYDTQVYARIITTTSQDLTSLIEEGKFRKDLFHRLNAIVFELVPLRKRKQDILKLAEQFVEKFSAQYNIPVNEIDKDVVEYLKEYEWPGNIRELKAAIERAVLLCEDQVLRCDNFKDLTMSKASGKNRKNEADTKDIIKLELPFKEYDLIKMNKLYVRQVLEKLNGNKLKTAKLLGISRPTLDNLLE